MPKDIFEMDVEGIDEVIKQLEQLGQDIEEAIEPALAAASMEVVNSAKGKANYKTGTLRRKITYEVDGHDARVGVEADVPYAAREEFGFIGTDSRWRTYNYAGTPYLRPALQESTSAINQVFISSVQDVIRSLSK